MNAAFSDPLFWITGAITWAVALPFIIVGVRRQRRRERIKKAWFDEAWRRLEGGGAGSTEVWRRLEGDETHTSGPDWG